MSEPFVEFYVCVVAMDMSELWQMPIGPGHDPLPKTAPKGGAEICSHHTIAPTILRPRSARRFRASRSMQAIRTATPIST